MRKPTSISELLGQGKATLERLRTGAQAADRTLSATQQALPEELRPHVWGAVLEEDRRLVVLVDAAGWATRVRYAVPELKAQVSAALGRPVEKVAVRVRPKT